MKSSRIITIASVLLLAQIWCGRPAHASLLDALFSPTYNEFKNLVVAGDKKAAAALLTREASYFEKLDKDKRAVVDAFRQSYFLDQLAELVSAGRDGDAFAKINAQIERLRVYSGEANSRYLAMLETLNSRQVIRLTRQIDELDEADNTPAPIKRWRSLKAALATVPIKYGVAGSPAMFLNSEQAHALLLSKRQAITSKLQAEAKTALEEYGWFSSPAFLEIYPIKIDMPSLVGDGSALLTQLEGASAAKIKRFSKMYQTALTADVKRKVAGIYLRRLVSDRGAKSYLDKCLLVDEAKKDGFEASSSVLFAAWSPGNGFERIVTLQAPKVIKLVALKADQNPSDVLESVEARQSDLIVFLRFQDPGIERSEKSRQAVNSRYQSGFRTVNNPRYDEAVAAVSKAESDLALVTQQSRIAQSNDSSGLGLAIALLSAATDSAARSALDEARQNLARTPRVLQEPNYINYTYTRSVQHVERAYRIKFAIYDSGSGDTYVDELRPAIGKDFTVVEGVNAADPDFAAIGRGAADAKVIDQYINSPLKDGYDMIGAIVLEKYGKAKNGGKK